MDNTFDTVSSLNSVVSDLFSPYYNIVISVTGELSNVKLSNNNLFCNLRDNESSINVMFWGYKYKYDTLFANGDNVKIVGKLSVYIKTGSYNIIASSITKLAIINPVSNVHLQYEQSKKKYDALGYFSNKKSPPSIINNIAIVTAREGAALQDILYVFNKNNFVSNIIIKSCAVQGKHSVSSIIESLQYLYTQKLDTILITRGGGSFEDLIAFSHDDVIEEIHKSPIFTISAVGHEIDFMLSDFVADYRAPTPSIAASYICNINKECYDEFNNITQIVPYFNDSLLENIQNKDSVINKLYLKLSSHDINNVIANDISELKYIKQHILNTLTTKINKNLSTISDLNSKLLTNNIDSNLNNGYSMILKGSNIIDSSNKITSGQKLKIKFKDGYINVVVL